MLKQVSHAQAVTAPFDVVIAGGGRLGIQTLSHLSNAIEEGLSPSMRILLVHDEVEFGGAAYGLKASPIPLPLHQEIPRLDRSGEFQQWLSMHKEAVFSFIASHGGAAGRKWLDNHQEAFERGDYGERRLPRAVYGLFLLCKLQKIAAGSKALVFLARGRLHSPRITGEGYELKVENETLNLLKINDEKRGPFYFPAIEEKESISLESVIAERVVWCPGLMPNAYHADVESYPHYFRTLYDPRRNLHAVHSTLNRLHMDKKGDIEVVIGGGGASAMDIFSWLYYHPDLMDKIKIHMLAGTLRERPAAILSEKGVAGERFLPCALTRFFQHAVDIESAAADDISAGVADGFSHAEVLRTIYPHIFNAAMALEPESRHTFYETILPRLMNRHFFLEAVETVEAYQEMKRRGRMNFVQGRIHHDHVRATDEGISVIYEQHGQTRVITGDVFLNCLGAVGKHVLHYNNCVINPVQHLLKDGFARLNPTCRGVQVDDDHQLVGAKGCLRRGFYMAGFLINGSVMNGVATLGGNPDGAAAAIAGHIVSQTALSPGVA